MSFAEKFSTIFSESKHNLDNCEQKQLIDELNCFIDEMDEEEMKSAINIELFNRIIKKMEEKNLSLENAVLLLKHIGFCKSMCNFWNNLFDYTSLRFRFEKLIIDESEKKEERNEKLLIDLCECYLTLRRFANNFPDKLLTICASCLLKVSLNKEQSVKTQKEIEMALIAFSCISLWKVEESQLYIDEIIEIIQHHQEHHNLTQLAYQSAWEFLISRSSYEKSLECVIVNELHFVREVTKELEELEKCVDWKKKEKRIMKYGEVYTIMRWCKTVESFVLSAKTQEKDYVKFVECILRLFKSARNNYWQMFKKHFKLFSHMMGSKIFDVYDLSKAGCVDFMLKEIHSPTLEEEITTHFTIFFQILSKRLKLEMKEKSEEPNRKLSPKEIFDVLEEDGYEDIMFSLQGFLLNNRFNVYICSINLCDYF
ncbi:uncharacterized protein MONOS_17820 [Monocercomonoides exilis]|uniref:uncharacterized protein n=1 Tax=Monocercomonoides exilis TaxID=2049356 RepID=UPI0035595626|nr:hypothetical protein MONOS_17820 [Monocercomonoides exilis]